MDAARGQMPNPPGTPKPDAEAVKRQAGEAVQDAKEQVQGAKEQVQESAGQAADQVKQFASTQVGTQKDRVTQSLGGVTEALRQASGQLREGEQGAFFAQYADTAADRVQKFADHLNERDISELLMDVEGYARRQPALFLGGAFVLGIFAARYLKSSSQRASGGNGAYGAGYEVSDTGMYRPGTYRPGANTGGNMDRSFDERGVGMRDANYRESLRRGAVPHQAAAPGTLPPAPRGAAAPASAAYTGQIPTGPNAMTGQATAGQANATSTTSMQGGTGASTRPIPTATRPAAGQANPQGSTGAVRSTETD